MCGSGGTPAAKKDIEADDQVDEPDDAQPQRQASVSVGMTLTGVSSGCRRV